MANTNKTGMAPLQVDRWTKRDIGTVCTKNCLNKVAPLRVKSINFSNQNLLTRSVTTTRAMGTTFTELRFGTTIGAMSTKFTELMRTLTL